MLFAAESVRRLREAGLRVTAPRLAVIAVLADHPHATADVGLVRGVLDWAGWVVPVRYHRPGRGGIPGGWTWSGRRSSAVAGPARRLPRPGFARARR